ncbi:MAG: hypothetical protein Q8K71_04145 [Polaromonas sp.]|nr:hypothetical protein [Polaromonas sp.]MDP3751480.1 hypothetical protein [Polaromonas sp.]
MSAQQNRFAALLCALALIASDGLWAQSAARDPLTVPSAQRLDEALQEKQKAETQISRIEAFRASLSLPKDAAAELRAQEALAKAREALAEIDKKIRMAQQGRHEPGTPVLMACRNAEIFMKALEPGMAVQREAMARTRAQIDAALGEHRVIDDERRTMLAKAAYKEATEIVKSTMALKARVEALESSGLSLEQRRKWLERIKSIDNLGKQIDSSGKLYGAASEFHGEFPKLTNSLKDELFEINKLFVNSGAADALGGELAKTFGPVGGLAFRAGKLSIDMAYVEGKGILNESELVRARDNFDVMHYQYSRIDEKYTHARSDFSQQKCGTRP